MNEKDLYNYFYKYMTKNEQKNFLETLKNYTLATKINPEEDFIIEATEFLCKKYPFMKIVIQEEIEKLNIGQKLT